MNGAELVAGSRPRRRRSNGNIDPTVQPITQIATSVTPIVINDSIAGGTTALNYWRNHAADYPFVDVRINNADGEFQGYKVTN